MSDEREKSDRHEVGEYSSTDYWRERYKRTNFQAVDWYLDFEHIKPIFLRVMNQTFGRMGYSVVEDKFVEQNDVARDFFEEGSGISKPQDQASNDNKSEGEKRNSLTFATSGQLTSKEKKQQALLSRLKGKRLPQQGAQQDVGEWGEVTRLERSLLSVLDVGCGTSEFSLSLFREGFTQLTCIDSCKEVIDVMTERFNSLPETQEILYNVGNSRSAMAELDISHAANIKYLVMSMQHLRFGKASFDVVLDKGSLDCLFAGAEVLEMVTRYLDGVHRVLKEGGVAIIFTLGAPDARIKYLDRKRYSWTITKQQLGHMRYVYFLKKPKNVVTAEEQIFKLNSLYDATAKMQKIAVDLNAGKLEVNERRQEVEKHPSINTAETRLKAASYTVEDAAFSSKLEKLYMQDN